jgi:hypothetical protein
LLFFLGFFEQRHSVVAGDYECAAAPVMGQRLLRVDATDAWCWDASRAAEDRAEVAPP